jgi:hypothetical protein
MADDAHGNDYIMSLEKQPCRMCGGVADTREHKFKRSDLRRTSLGSAPKQAMFLSEQGFQPLQGPNSKLVKFGKVLCSQCNSSRTQPYDNAYHRLSTWLAREGDDFLNRREMDFQEIYGHDYKVGVSYLLRYFVKHLGCRIADSNFSVPVPLKAALTNKNLAPFEASFAVNVTWAGLPQAEAVLVNYPRIGLQNAGEIGDRFMSGFSIGYLTIVYRCGFPVYMPWEGESLDCAKRIVALGRCDPAGRRSFRIGNRDYKVPALTERQRRWILDHRPRDGMSDEEKLDAWLTGVHEIFLPGYPGLEKSDLAVDLTLRTCQEIWETAFSLDEIFL